MRVDLFVKINNEVLIDDLIFCPDTDKEKILDLLIKAIEKIKSTNLIDIN